jgi:hypothetical protein
VSKELRMIMDLVMVDVSIGNGPLDELRARRDAKRLGGR